MANYVDLPVEGGQVDPNAVTNPTGPVVSGNLAVFDGTSGTVIKDGGAVPVASTAFRKLATYNPTNHAFTSTSFADINGVTNQTISIPTTGTYVIRMELIGPYVSGADIAVTFGLVIDNAVPIAFVETPLGFSSLLPRICISVTMSTSLTAGSHTFRVQAKLANNASSRTLNFSSAVGALQLDFGSA